VYILTFGVLLRREKDPWKLPKTGKERLHRKGSTKALGLNCGLTRHLPRLYGHKTTQSLTFLHRFLTLMKTSRRCTIQEISSKIWIRRETNYNHALIPLAQRSFVVVAEMSNFIDHDTKTRISLQTQYTQTRLIIITAQKSRAFIFCSLSAK